MEWIVIACWLADDSFVKPKGHYRDWQHCNEYVEYFEQTLFPKYKGKVPLCWCSKEPAPVIPVPRKKSQSRYGDDRKSQQP